MAIGTEGEHEKMMDISQILIWIAVGAMLTIISTFVYLKIRDYRRRFVEKHYPPTPEDYSVGEAIDRQTTFLRAEQRERFHRADAVKEALEQQQTDVKAALEQQQTDVKAALEQQQTDVKEVLGRQQTDIKDALAVQQKLVKEDLITESEMIENALTNYNSAKKQDVTEQTENIKAAFLESVEARKNEEGEKSE